MVQHFIDDNTNFLNLPYDGKVVTKISKAATSRKFVYALKPDFASFNDGLNNTGITFIFRANMKKRLFQKSFCLPALALAFYLCVPVHKEGNMRVTSLTYQHSSTGIEGVWIGEYVVDNLGQIPLFYSLSIFPDGTILTKSLGGNGATYFSEGTWVLKDNKFTAYIISLNHHGASPVKQTIIADHLKDCGLTNATWFDTENLNPNSNINSGKFINLKHPVTDIRYEDLVAYSKKPAPTR